MDASRIFNLVLGGALFVAVGVLAWNYLYPGGVILSAKNNLGVADCEFTVDKSEVWKISLKPDETVSRLLIFGMPARVEWACQTSSGPASGSAFENCGPLNHIILGPSKEYTVMC